MNMDMEHETYAYHTNTNMKPTPFPMNGGCGVSGSGSGGRATKKTFYYNFFPTKLEEMSEEATMRPHQVTRALMEIRDLHPATATAADTAGNTWPIRKSPTAADIVTGKMVLSDAEMLGHVIRHWSMDTANYVLVGNRLPIEVRDFTDDAAYPVRYRGDSIFIEKAGQDSFVLGWGDLVRTRFVSPGEEVGLFWDVRSSSLHLKVLRRGRGV